MIPKSLHTVTAVVNVATFLQSMNCDLTNSQAVTRAIHLLGYSSDRANDPHCISARALATIERSALE
jgi:hypothetical protein